MAGFGTTSPNLYTFGFDNGTAGSIKVQLAAVTISAGPAYAGVISNPPPGNGAGSSEPNRYGAGVAIDPAAAGKFWTFGGMASTATAFGGGAAQQDSFVFDTATPGFTAGPSTNAPSSRGYMAMAGTTAAAGVLVYGGIASECTLGSTTAEVPLYGSSAGCTTAGQQPLDDPVQLNSGAWSQVLTGPGDVGIGRLASEAGGSVHGFYDANTNRLWVYRPTVQTMNSFPLVQAPAVLVKFDASNASVAVTGSQVTAFTVTLNATTASHNGSTLGAKVFVFNQTTAAWVNQTGSFTSGAYSFTANTGTTPTAATYFSTGGSTLWVLVQPSTLNANFDFKGVTVTGPSLSVTAN